MNSKIQKDKHLESKIVKNCNNNNSIINNKFREKPYCLMLHSR